MWFPEAAGCYYVTVNTQEEEWSALHISSLTVSGLTNEDVTMSFDKENNQWIATFTADATGIFHTLQAMILFAFIIVIPVRKIPREAIESFSEKDGHVQARLKK